MLIPVPTSDCLQAREAASARLDGELSELESARLNAHLRECAASSVYALEVSAIAETIRGAPLARPQLDLTLPRRRALPVVRVAAAAAAIFLVAAGSTLALQRGLGSGSKPAATVIGPPSILAGLRADAVDQRLFAMLRPQVASRSHQVGRVIFA